VAAVGASVADVESASAWHHYFFSAGCTLQSAADELFKLVAQRIIREKQLHLCAECCGNGASPH
jgi:hypothetical protein